MTQAFDFFVQVANFPEFSCGGQIPVPGKYRIDELRPIWVKASFGVQNISRISPKYQTAISRSYNSNHGPKVILRLERARENCERHRCFGGCQLALLATRLLSISSFSLQKKRDGHRPEEPRTTSRSTPRVSPPVQAKCRLSPCALRRPLSCPASPPPSLVSYPSRVSDFFSVFLPNRRASDRRSNGVAPRPDRALQRSIDRMADTNLSDSFHPQALARLCAARPSRPAVSCRRPR